MNIWIVSREYNGIAEAGGVKNVTCSLAENLVRLGQLVTLFIPLYGCTNLSGLQEYRCIWHHPVVVRVQGRHVIVTFCRGVLNGVEIVFVCNRAFSDKKAVYTYTKEEELKNPRHRKGSGHEDAAFLNTLFQKAVAAYGETCVQDESPDIIHCQDATTAFIPSFVAAATQSSSKLAAFYRNTRCLVTIHNAGAGYHHEFGSLDDAVSYTGLPREELAQGLCNGRVEPFLLAAGHACLTTVSPEYAQELMRPNDMTGGLSDALCRRHVTVTGITNGIDFARYDPADTAVSLLPYPFSPQDGDLDGKYRCRDVFLGDYASRACMAALGRSVEQHGYIDASGGADSVYIAYHGRVVTQKGIPVLVAAAERLLKKQVSAKFIFIGQGEPELERELVRLSESYPGSCVFFNGYDRALSRLCIAAADFAVFPSFFEPCGLEDFIAQVYGTIPVAHATGGLCKIIDEKTGFLYKENSADELFVLLYALTKVLAIGGRKTFAPMIRYAARYIREHYAWEHVAKDKYITLYRRLLGM
ncbi:MAG TPA: glycogen synthase [Treponema sp.]|nr:glycogen synthase [Treponema sp.]